MRCHSTWRIMHHRHHCYNSPVWTELDWIVSSRNFCDYLQVFVGSGHWSRREFLARAGAGFGAVALHALTASQAWAGKSSKTPLSDPLNPYAARPPHFAPKAKSVIFLFMVGGPSHVDTFDYKPELQKLDGKPVPESLRKAVEATKFANVFHGCKDELMASPYEIGRAHV